jgi:hypothetical protein
MGSFAHPALRLASLEVESSWYHTGINPGPTSPYLAASNVLSLPGQDRAIKLDMSFPTPVPAVIESPMQFTVMIVLLALANASRQLDKPESRLIAFVMLC